MEGREERLGREEGGNEERFGRDGEEDGRGRGGVIFDDYLLVPLHQ